MNTTIKDCPHCGAGHGPVDVKGRSQRPGVYVHAEALSTDFPPTKHVVCLVCGSGSPSVDVWNKRHPGTNTKTPEQRAEEIALTKRFNKVLSAPENQEKTSTIRRMLADIENAKFKWERLDRGWCIATGCTDIGVCLESDGLWHSYATDEDEGRSTPGFKSLAAAKRDAEKRGKEFIKLLTQKRLAALMD